MLSHLGQALDNTIQMDEWCKRHHITTGAEYLKLWAMYMIRRPEISLPYLFFHSQTQQTGKSKYHEALKLLMKGDGVYMDAGASLQSSGNFNGELASAVLCYIEEKNLSKGGGSQAAYNKIKDWVTSPDFLVHIKGHTPYMRPNFTHWVHCANNRSFCPVFPGDKRITMVHAQLFPLGTEIPAEEFLAQMADEAPAFTHTILHGKIPPPFGRLALPPLDIPDKIEAMATTKDAVTLFMDEHTFAANGHVIGTSLLFSKFLQNLRAGDDPKWWSPRRFMASMPDIFVRGNFKGVWSVANRSLGETKSIHPPLVLHGQDLMSMEQAAAERKADRNVR
jgi:hypothetical protein